MTTITTELAQRMRTAAEKATPGEWWADEVENEGSYGSGDDCVEGFTSYAIYGSDGQTLFDSLNSDAACISEEYDGEGHVAWDETAQRNAEFIALANPANVLALLDALEAKDKQLEIATQNIRDGGHAMSDLRRFIETKWPGVADVTSQEGVLLKGPESKHEADALIAALNRVADFYELEARPEQQPVEPITHATKFPVTRPTPGAKVVVWDEVGKFLGCGSAVDNRQSGVAIHLTDGRRFDSNHELRWMYALQPAAQPVTVKLPERHELQETSRNPYQSYMQMLPEPEGDWVRHDDVVEVLTLAGINVAEASGD